MNTQLFPINVIELANKKVMVRLEVADKGKGKNIVIGEPRMSNISLGVIAQKALGKKTNKSRGARGQVRSNSRTKLHVSRIANSLAPPHGLSGAQADNQADSSERFGNG